MKITKSEGSDWREWVLVTSIPLVQLDGRGGVTDCGIGAMIDHAGSRFILAVEHVVKRESSGWAAVVQQDGSGQLEYYRPNAFSFVGEIKRNLGSVRLLDLCAAQVSPELQTWYEHRTPRGLFDKRPHQVFNTTDITTPNAQQLYAFSGQVRIERHGADTFVSDAVVYPGLAYSHSEGEFHHFKLPVSHPGHDAFKGCSGSPIVDFNRKLVALVVGGDTTTGTIKGVAIHRVLPNLEFLASRAHAALAD